MSIYEKEATKKVLASLISIAVGLLVGIVVVVIVGLTKETITGQGIWDGVRLIFAGIFSTGRDAAGKLTWGYNPQSWGNMLFRAMPLVMTGLSVAVAYKTGLFNIGAPGQYLMGTLASLMIALGIPSETVPAGLIWVLAFLGGCLAGALWGCIPGLLKAFLNINEVLACIMTNWLAANLEVNYQVLYTGIALNDTHVSSESDLIACTIYKVSTDEKIDIAIIQTNNKVTPPEVDRLVDLNDIATMDELKPGKRIYTIGFPQAKSDGSCQSVAGHTKG